MRLCSLCGSTEICRRRIDAKYCRKCATKKAKEQSKTAGILFRKRNPQYNKQYYEERKCVED